MTDPNPSLLTRIENLTAQAHEFWDRGDYLAAASLYQAAALTELNLLLGVAVRHMIGGNDGEPARSGGNGTSTEPDPGPTRRDDGGAEGRNRKGSGRRDRAVVSPTPQGTPPARDIGTEGSGEESEG